MKASASLERSQHVRAMDPPVSTPMDSVVPYAEMRPEAADAMEVRHVANFHSSLI